MKFVSDSFRCKIFWCVRVTIALQASITLSLRLTEKPFPFLLAEKVPKLFYEQVVRLALAPLNLEPFALIFSLRHALWFRRYPICRASVPAPRVPEFVGAA
jgi:hypothetical protein